MALNSRKKRKQRRQYDMRMSRMENGLRKRKERVRRDASMLTLVKSGQLPFTPAIISWLSVKLDKPGRLITVEDVQKVVSQ